MTNKCSECGCLFERRYVKKYCSLACYWKSLKGKMPKSPPPHKPKVFIVCPICKKVFKRNKSSVVCCSKKCAGELVREKFARYCILCGKRRPSVNKMFCSKECGHKHRIRDNHPSWKGGIKKDRDRRKSYDCSQWRKSVFERDNYTCQNCGVKGGYLEAHHIKSFARHIETRHEISNGVTLCKDCHKLTNNYGAKNCQHNVLKTI